MVTNLAKKAMTTKGQKACLIIDHLVQALGSDPSCPLRRALVLVDIGQNPGTTQAEIMERLKINKSTVNRDIEWMYNYACIRLKDSKTDARTKEITVDGYARTALDGALGYFDGNAQNLKIFIEGYINILRQEKATLRDAKVISALYEKGSASKQEVIDTLYNGSASTNNRTVNKLIEEGIVANDEK